MKLGPLPPRRRLALPGGGHVQAVCSGSGNGPPVVLVNGAGVTLDGWRGLYPAVEALGSAVFAWDRPGVGGSSPPATAQTAAEVTGTLRGLLAQCGLAPPFVLVAHSIGGLHVQWFARHHPNEVAGILMLDATHPDDPRRLRGQESRIAAVLQSVFALPQRLFPANPHGEVDCVGATVRQVQQSPGFPPVPLTVLSGGKTPPAWMVKPAAHAIRQEHQAALAALSPLGEHRFADRSGHFPQLTEPAVVLDALARLLARATPPV